MDYTMLQQMAHHCQLLVKLHNTDFNDPILQNFVDILEPKRNMTPVELDSTALALFLSQVPQMSAKEYNLVLSYLNTAGESFLSWLSHPSLDYRNMILPLLESVLVTFILNMEHIAVCQHMMQTV
jgi:hypothetical protein